MSPVLKEVAHRIPDDATGVVILVMRGNVLHAIVQNGVCWEDVHAICTEGAKGIAERLRQQAN